MEMSDLTKDTRETLELILVNSIRDVVSVDRSKEVLSGEHVRHENETFYYRVMFLFMQRAINYYTSKEIEDWVKVEIMDEAILPEIKGYGLDNL